MLSGSVHNIAKAQVLAHTLSPGSYRLASSPTKFIQRSLSCVSGRDDLSSQETQYWLTFIQAEGRGSIQTFFRSIFAQHPRAHSDFALSAYACMLNRDPGEVEWANVNSVLTGGWITQAGIVEAVLGSPEFKFYVLPFMETLMGFPPLELTK